eukprot:4126188-Pleurochrysis_carterae.AAC.1
MAAPAGPPLRPGGWAPGAPKVERCGARTLAWRLREAKMAALAKMAWPQPRRYFLEFQKQASP